MYIDTFFISSTNRLRRFLLFLLQRINFGWAEEKDAMKAEIIKEAAAQASSKWPWQGLVKNLQMAQQEL